MNETLKEGPYIQVCVGYKKLKIIRKSSPCWLLKKNRSRANTDRVKRFVIKTSKKLEKSGELIGRQQKNRPKRITSKRKYRKRYRVTETS